MNKSSFLSLRSIARLAALGLCLSAPGFAGFRGGYPGPYWRPFPHYYPGRWRGGWGWGPRYVYPGLPRGYVSFTFGGAPWYYCGGFWYRPWGASFIVDAPPIGLVIPFLPLGCSTLVYGGATYYTLDDTYYTAAPSGPGYVVAAPPPDQPLVAQPPPAQPPAAQPAPAPPQPAPGSADALALDALVIFPKNGQSEEKMLQDRRDAMRFASAQTGYDPARSDPNDPGTPRARQDYLRSMKAYLEQRGYSVH